MQSVSAIALESYTAGERARSKTVAEERFHEGCWRVDGTVWLFEAISAGVSCLS